jgi:hypothetical protein
MDDIKDNILGAIQNLAKKDEWNFICVYILNKAIIRINQYGLILLQV